MKLLKEVEVCQIHLERLEEAYLRIKYLFPLTQNTLTTLKFEELAFLELFTSRLAKLQDALGAKVFPLLLEGLGEGTPKDTLIDRLNKLEKLELISSTTRWKQLREMRNTLAHDYPDTAKCMADTLNAYSLAIDEFKDIMQKIAIVIQEKLQA